MRATVVLMLKQPVAGRVKTRLGRDIGMTAAAWWFRHQSRRVIRRLRDPRWNLVLAVSPDHALMSPVWPADLPRIAQGQGGLGDRMGRVFASVPGPVLIVGADIPALDRHAIAVALDALRGHDAVIGPASDGGYWLIGLRNTARLPATLFQNVRWSTQHARADTLRGMSDLRIAYAATLDDVDEAHDL